MGIPESRIAPNEGGSCATALRGSALALEFGKNGRSFSWPLHRCPQTGSSIAGCLHSVPSPSNIPN
jgi:hypothetical protein